VDLESNHSDYLMIFNMGNPQEVSVLDIAQEIIYLTESHSRIVFRPLPENDPKVRRPDITRARAILGWEPKVSRHEGLRLTLPYFRSALEKKQLARMTKLSVR
jgi:dTDP-glucose 4,6-dehydratase